MKQNLLLSLLLALYFTPPVALAVGDEVESTNSPQSCESALNEQELIQAGFSSLNFRYGDRGFLGVQPEVNTSTLDVAGKFGVIRGEQLIFLADNEEEAIKHAKSADKNDSTRSLYIIKKETSINDHDTFFDEKVLKQTSLIAIEEGEVTTRLDSKQTWKLLGDTKKSFRIRTETNLTFFSLEGWLLPKKRSVITRKSVDEGANTYGSIRKFTAEALKGAYRVIYNNRPSIAANLANVKSQESNEKSIAVGSKVQGFLNLMEKKRAFSVEVYAPSDSEVARNYGEGGMVAGVLGHIQGKLFVIDSLFYPPISNGEKYAQMAIYSLIHRLFAVGVDSIDATKVTRFAKKSLRAQTLSSEELTQLIAQLPEGATLNTSEFHCEEFDCN